MRRNPRLPLLLLVILLVVLPACQKDGGDELSPSSETSPPPSLLLVTIDTWRSDSIGLSGSGRVKTPTLDELGRTGIYVRGMETPCPLTTPAHASLFTGVGPLRHGILDCAQYTLGPVLPTVAEGFKGGGYDTAAFVASETLKRRFGLDRGFDVYEEKGLAKRSQDDWLSATKDGGEITNDVLAYLTRATGKAPLFLWVHYYDLHVPYRPRPAYADVYPDDPYAQQAAYVDDQISRLLQWIRKDQRHAWRILIVGDHGEGLGDHGEVGHGYGLHKAVRTVPLIVWPSPDKPLRCEEPWTLMDLDPTLREWFSLERNPDVDGVDLFQVERRDHLVYSSTFLPSFTFSVTPTLSARDGRYLYIRHGSEELYDLAEDPEETNNLVDAPRTSAIRGRMKEACDERFSSEKIQELLSPSLDVSADEEERLRSLGYLTGSTPDMQRLQQADLYELLKDFEALEASREACYRHRDCDRLAAGYDAFVRKYPHAASMFKNYGKLLIQLKQYGKAEAVLTRATKLDARDADSFLNLGTLQLMKGSVDKAEALLLHALTLKPEEPVIHKNLAILYADFKKEPANALQYFRSYLREMPNAPDRVPIEEYIRKHEPR